MSGEILSCPGGPPKRLPQVPAGRSAVEPLVRRVLDDLGEIPDFDPDSGLVLALSGGPDSTALLNLLLDAGIAPGRMVAAHLDHGLRPESEADAKLAEEAAAAAGVRFCSTRLSVPDRLRPGAGGTEAVARRVRYRWLERVAVESGFPWIATGHHRDDQAETVLLRILRGTGPDGLAGILRTRPVRRGAATLVVRPLLRISRIELREWLDARSVPYARDPTNDDGSNLRSRVRTSLLPALRSRVPDVVPRLAALADLARARSLAFAPRPPGPIPVTPALARLPSLLRSVLRSALPEGGPPLDRRSMKRATARVRAGRGACDLGSGWRLVVGGGTLRVRRTAGRSDPGPSVTLPLPGSRRIGGAGRLTAAWATGEIDADPYRQTLDAERAPPPYQVRFARAGDRFRPLGFDGETTVFRFLMGQRVPREERPRTPVVLAAGRTVWVVGRRIDERAKVDAGTRRRVELRFEPGGATSSPGPTSRPRTS